MNSERGKIKGACDAEWRGTKTSPISLHGIDQRGFTGFDEDSQLLFVRVGRGRKNLNEHYKPDANMT